jgi:hypothetical protein
MNRLPTACLANRLNALAAAAVVTLTLLAGIDSRAAAQTAVPQLAQASTERAA